MPAARQLVAVRCWLALLIVAFVVAFGSRAAAYEPPQREGHVTDTSHMLFATEEELEAKLETHRVETTDEVAVLVTAPLHDARIQEVAFATLHAWKLGAPGRDNGVLLVWSPFDRKVHIERGADISARLSEERASLIVREIVQPRFAEQRWAEGVSRGVDAILSALRGEPFQGPPSGLDAGTALPGVLAIDLPGGRTLELPTRSSCLLDVADALTPEKEEEILRGAPCDARHDGPVVVAIFPSLGDRTHGVLRAVRKAWAPRDENEPWALVVLVPDDGRAFVGSDPDYTLGLTLRNANAEPANREAVVASTVSHAFRTGAERVRVQRVESARRKPAPEAPSEGSEHAQQTWIVLITIGMASAVAFVGWRFRKRRP